MNVTYQINENLEYCNVNFDGKIYDYDSLRKTLNAELNEFTIRFKNISNIKSNSKILDSKIYKKGEFEKSNLTENEIREYFFEKKHSKAKSWISLQRRKRKEGKLSQIQVESLNKLGMLWNPTSDDWEKSYKLYRGEDLMQTLKIMKNDEDAEGGYHWIKRFKKLGEWINEQNELYQQNNLSKENLHRLQALDFQFKSICQRKTPLQLNVLLFIHRIRHLKRELSFFGLEKFIKYYDLDKNQNNEGEIKVREELVFKQVEKEKQKLNKESEVFLKKWDREQKEIEEKERTKLITKSKDDFIKLIDKISTIGPLTWNSKNNAYKGKNEKNIPIYIYKYHDIYLELQNFIEDKFNVVSKEKGYVSSFTIKFEFEREIKIYAAKRMIDILDKHLLAHGILNKEKKIIPISYLINEYLKDKNKEGIDELKILIEKHELLNLIYKKKLFYLKSKI